MVQFALADPEKLLYHNEPIWRNGAMVGHTTSGMYGHAVGAPLGLGYVENPDGIADRDFVTSGEYEVEVGCERVPATVSLTPLYDPRSERIRA